MINTNNNNEEKINEIQDLSDEDTSFKLSDDENSFEREESDDSLGDVDPITEEEIEDLKKDSREPFIDKYSVLLTALMAIIVALIYGINYCDLFKSNP